MLINLSNHPSNKWGLLQKKTADDLYDTIKDLPFPNIPPNATKKEVRKLVKKYKKIIINLNPHAVHLMGEMTFTYALVRKLKKLEIPVIASTTNRIVAEKEGKKIVQFQFVQFRAF